MSKFLAERIAEYVRNFSYKDLNQQAIKEAKRRIIDSIAVALPAINEEPIKKIRNVVEKTSSERSATIWSSGKKTSLDYASFVNSAMTRYYDYNDTYLSKEALHPSDCIAGLMAVAENLDLDGKDLILAINIAYEIICKLADAASIRERGWDHISYIAIGTAAALGKLMDLSTEKITQAINLTAANVITLRQTRIGELSMWKGLSAPNAVRNAVFYSLLAEQGVTGPAPVFEGERGFFKQVSGEFDLDFKTSFKIIETSIKNHPVEYHSMGAAEAAFKIRNKIEIENIESIEIDTFRVSYNIIVKDPEKWDPKTKETADHSLPFIVAYILAKGKIEVNSYYDLGDPLVKSLIKKMKIAVDEKLDKLYPEAVPARITIKSKEKTETEEVIYPKGHFKNPLSDHELENKFKKMIEPLLKDRTKDLLKDLNNIENKKVKDIVDQLVF